jgi:hypothetical protein
MASLGESFKPFQSGTGICKPSTDYYNVVTSKKGGAKRKLKKRKVGKHKVSKRKVSKRKVSKRKVSKRKVSKRKVSKRKVSKRKVSKRKVSKRKVSKRKVSKRKVSKRKVSKRKVSKRKVSKRKVSKRRVSKRGGGYKSLIPVRSSTSSDLRFNGFQPDQRFNPPIATKSENFGVAWKTTGGGKKSKRGGGENMGATGRPARWFDPNATDRSSMSADASRTFSHFRDLKPGPNGTGQTGGNTVKIHGHDDQPGVGSHMQKLKNSLGDLGEKSNNFSGGSSSDWRSSQYSRSLDPMDKNVFNAFTKTGQYIAPKDLVASVMPPSSAKSSGPAEGYDPNAVSFGKITGGKKRSSKSKSSKRKSSKNKSSKRKTTKRKTTKRKTTKRKTTKRKSSKRKTTKSKTSKRKTSKRKTSKRKTSKRKKTSKKKLSFLRRLLL